MAKWILRHYTHPGSLSQCNIWIILCSVTLVHSPVYLYMLYCNVNTKLGTQLSCFPGIIEEKSIMAYSSLRIQMAQPRASSITVTSNNSTAYLWLTEERRFALFILSLLCVPYIFPKLFLALTSFFCCFKIPSCSLSLSFPLSPISSFFNTLHSPVSLCYSPGQC